MLFRSDRISSEGPKLLRAYIDYAINGSESPVREVEKYDIPKHDLPFEKAVYNYLDKNGFKVDIQVGSSRYKIDMAVKHPKISGVYVLGVECDGAAYHSARTARERDRLRQEVLENMGWKIYRIWSTDWIKDPVNEGKNLVTAIKDAIDNYGEPPSSELSDEDETETDDYVSVNETEINTAEHNNRYGFEAAVETYLYGFPDVADCILAIVTNEFPIHYDLRCQRLAPLYGYISACKAVRKEVNHDISRLRGKIVKKGDFLFPRVWQKITVRVPTDRKLKHISTEELAEAMKTILKHTVGSTREGLCIETTRVFGVGRKTQGIGKLMNEICDLLIQQGIAQEIDGKIVLR